MADSGIQPTEVTFGILTRLFGSAGLDAHVQELQQLRGTLALLEGRTWPS